MASYLDKTGLTYFWSKIKTYVSNAISSGNAATVNGHSVNTDVPSNAVFTDTTYSDATQSSSGLMSATDKTTLDNLASGTVSDVRVHTSSSNSYSLVSDGVATIKPAANTSSDGTQKYGLMSYTDYTKLSATNILYATTSTAADTRDKDLTVVTPSSYVVANGTILILKSTYSNTATGATFRLGSSVTHTAVRYNGTSLYDSSLAQYGGHSTRYSIYVYLDGYWNWIGWSYDSDTYQTMSSSDIVTGSSVTAMIATPKAIHDAIASMINTALANMLEISE